MEKGMTDKLADFMVDLASNKGLQEAYKQDAEKTMKKHGVDDSDIKLMVDKDHDSIRKRLGTNYDISSNSIITAAKK